MGLDAFLIDHFGPIIVTPVLAPRSRREEKEPAESFLRASPCRRPAVCRPPADVLQKIRLALNWSIRPSSSNEGVSHCAPYVTASRRVIASHRSVSNVRRGGYG